jgi:hypothetical protein
MLQILFSSFSTKNVTKMLRKISRTHRKFFRIFCKQIWTDRGANIRKNKNMQEWGVDIAKLEKQAEERWA